MSDSHNHMSLFQELTWRDLVHTATTDAAEVLEKEKVTAYIGFDPTADSLHVGSFLQIMCLARLQRFGHSPIAIIGGGTGLVGDPSGKTAERQLLTNEQVEINLAGIRKQLEKFLDFETKVNPARIVNNADWLVQEYLMTFLRDIGKHFTINWMMQKESVKRRIESEDGISYTEFTYMLLQAYDFLKLHDLYGCNFQMGGSDQWGNITAGAELIRKLRGGRAHGMVYPLITNSSGTKFGKTESGTIWIDPKRTSPYRFYQFWYNTADADVIRYLKYFTWLTQDEIAELESGFQATPEKREAQKKLARELTTMVHGKTELDKAEHASTMLFSPEISTLGPDDLSDILADVPSSGLNPQEISAGKSMADLFVASGLASSKGDARRLIQGGGLYLNNNPVKPEQDTVTLNDSMHGRFFLLRKGKKDWHVIRLMNGNN